MSTLRARLSANLARPRRVVCPITPLTPITTRLEKIRHCQMTILSYQRQIQAVRSSPDYREDDYDMALLRDLMERMDIVDDELVDLLES